MESSAKKMVTVEEFDAAVKQVIHNQVRIRNWMGQENCSFR